MQAVVLFNETNLQLAPLSEHLSVPLVPLANRPLLVYTVELLASAGVEQIHVGLRHFTGGVQAHLGEGQRWNVHLNYLAQEEEEGMAILIKEAIARSAQPDEPILVLPANQLLDLDIEAALAAHQAHGGLATVICGKPISLSSGCKADVSRPTGAFVLDPKALTYIADGQTFDCEAQLVPALLASKQHVGTYENAGYWNPLTSFALYQKAQADFMESQRLSLVGNLAVPDVQPTEREVTPPSRVYIEGNRISDGIWCGAGSAIHPNARLMAPVLIGPGCLIGRDVELGPNVIIGANSVIDSGASVAESTILPNTYVGKLLNVCGRVVDRNLLIDVASEQYTRIADKFMLSEIVPPPTQGILFKLMERLLAFVILLLLSPLLLPIALAIFVSTNQAALVRTPRVGKRPSVHLDRKAGCSTVHLWQFRTRDSAQSSTAMGRWLERWSLHRLPELWHVVRGELGLVGVEPLSVEAAQQPMDEWQTRRFHYQMGFTGPWYTQRPADSQRSDGSTRYAAEIHYMATRSWRDDLLQLWWTPTAWRQRAQTSSSAALVSREEFSHSTLHQ